MASTAPGQQNGQRSADQLLAEFRDTGRQEPFEEVVRRYGPMVYATCFKVTKDRHDAEDAMQATFLSLAVQVKANKEIHYIGAWLQQVGHRLSLDIRRSKKRRKAREEKHHVIKNGYNSDGETPSPENNVGVDELKVLLTEELGELPAKYRVPLVLFYFGGMSREQIAAELSLKGSTLGVRMHRGREMLGERLAKRGIEISGAMLAAALASAVHSAIGDTIIFRTSQAAMHMTAGSAAASSVVSSRIVGLACGVPRALMMAKLRSGAIVALLAGSVIAAGARAIYRATEFFSLPTQIHLAPQSFPIPSFQNLIPSPRASAKPQGEIDNSYALSHVPTPTYEGAVIAAADVEVPTMTSAAHVEMLPPEMMIEPQQHPQAAPMSSGLSSEAVVAPPVSAMSSGESSSGGGSSGLSYISPAAAPPMLSSGSSSAGSYAAFAKFRGSLALVAPPGFSGLPGTSGFYATPLPVVPTRPTVSLQPVSQDFRSNPQTFSKAAMLAASGNTAGRSSWTMTSSTIRGFGVTNLTGTLDNSGQVIADGGTLDLSSLDGVTNTTDNCNKGGCNGWFAVNGGKLVLPSINLDHANQLVTWGENPKSTVLDLVNSVRLEAGEVDAPTKLSISLVSNTNKEIPDFADRAGMLGIWHVLGDGDLHDLTLDVRYDDTLAKELGADENNLQLWEYDGSWHQVDSLTRDSADHILGGTSLTAPSFFAVVVPEPATVTVLALAGAGMLMRRNRRK